MGGSRNTAIYELFIQMYRLHEYTSIYPNAYCSELIKLFHKCDKVATSVGCWLAFIRSTYHHDIVLGSCLTKQQRSRQTIIWQLCSKVQFFDGIQFVDEKEKPVSLSRQAKQTQV